MDNSQRQSKQKLMETVMNHPGAAADELIINAENVALLKKHQLRIHEMYGVELKLGFVSETESNGLQQWVEVRGPEENRKTAKEYIKAMCNPQETLPMPYPEGMHDILTDPDIHYKLEKLSKAAILFENNGNLTICGADNLSVTLAMSSIEELIHKYLKEATPVGDLPSPTSHVANRRLDRELRRLSSEDRSLDWGEGDVKKMNSNAVKRALLSLCAEDSSNTAGQTAGSFGSAAVKPDGVSIPTGMKAAACAGSMTKSSVSPTSSSVSSDSHSPSFQTENIMREVALSRGYTESEIQDAFRVTGPQLKSSEFLKALMNNRKVKSDNSMEVEEPTAVTNTPEKATKKASDGDEVNKVALAKLKSPPPSADEVTPHLQDYFQRLGQDAEEEHSCGLDELKKRNERRQQLLREAYLHRVEASPSICATPVAEINDEEEPMLINSGSSEDDDVQYLDYFHPAKVPVKTGTKLNGSHEKGKSIDTLDDFSLPFQHPDEKGGKFGTNSQTVSPVKHRGKTQNQDKMKVFKKPVSEVPTWQQQELMNTETTKKDRSYKPRSPSPKHKMMRGNGMSTNEFASREQTTGKISTTTVPSRPKRRHVIIDGSNVAMAHGKRTVYSCRGIRLCVQFFLNRGHTEITALVPQFRTRWVPESQLTDQNILQELQEEGSLEFTPSRRVGTKNIVPYDDRLMLQTAQLTDGVIISNDNYRDLYREKPEWRDIIEHRLIQFMFVGDMFIVPEDDPVGRHGPTLEGLLTVPEPEKAHGRIMSHSRIPDYHSVPGENTRQQFPPQNRKQNQFMDMHNHPNHAVQPGTWGYGQGQAQGQGPARMPLDRGHAVPGHKTDLNWQHNQFNAQRAVISSSDDRHSPMKSTQKTTNPSRSVNDTEKMLKQLLLVFPTEEPKIRRVLQNHPSETDLNKLSSYLLAV